MTPSPGFGQGETSRYPLQWNDKTSLPPVLARVPSPSQAFLTPRYDPLACSRPLLLPLAPSLSLRDSEPTSDLKRYPSNSHSVELPLRYTRVVTFFVATSQRLITSRTSLLGVSAQMQGVGVPASDSMPYSHSHTLDSIAEMVATAASTSVSNVVGMIDRPERASRSDESEAVRSTSLSSFEPSHSFLLIALTSSTRQTRRPSPSRTYTSSASKALSRFVTASQGARFPSMAPSQSKSSPPQDRWSLCAPGPLGPSRLPESEPARVGL